MAASVMQVIAYAAWAAMLAVTLMLVGVVIAGIVEKTVEDIL